jgi:hypothetical protein
MTGGSAGVGGGAAGAAGNPGVGGEIGGAGTGTGGAAGGSAGTTGATGGAPGTGGSAGGHAGSAGGSAGSADGSAGSAGGQTGGVAGGAGQSGAAGGQSGATGGNTGGAGGAAGQGGIVLGGGGAGGAAACQAESITFTPRAPTVLVLVDRGGASFTTATTGTFFNLRSAIEQTISTLQSQVRFGLAVYVGNHPSTTCQLDYESVAPALENAIAIKTVYDGLGPLQPFGTKADTPATEALPMAQAALKADLAAGDRYLLFVTTGDTDFCDDGDSICSADAVTYQLQAAYAGTPHIATRIVGIPVSVAAGLEPTFLQNQANAGAGQPAVVPVLTGQTTPYTAQDIYFECADGTDGGADSWSSLYMTKGLTTTTPLATYGTATSAPLYMAASTSVADLTTAVSAALSSMKSCTFDLSTFSIDTTRLGEASVKIDGTTIAQSTTNGWSMPTGTELVLNGTACAAFQTATTIGFDFPCDIVKTN